MNDSMRESDISTGARIAARHYQVGPADGISDEWALDVETVPHPCDGVYAFQLTGTEAEMQTAGVFARSREDVELSDLYEMTAKHIGRDIS